MPQAVQGPNSDNLYRLDVGVSKLAATLATDLATLFTDIAKELGGKEKEGPQAKTRRSTRGQTRRQTGPRQSFAVRTALR